MLISPYIITTPHPSTRQLLSIPPKPMALYLATLTLTALSIDLLGIWVLIQLQQTNPGSLNTESTSPKPELPNRHALEPSPFLSQYFSKPTVSTILALKALSISELHDLLALKHYLTRCAERLERGKEDEEVERVLGAVRAAEEALRGVGEFGFDAVATREVVWRVVERVVAGGW